VSEREFLAPAPATKHRADKMCSGRSAPNKNASKQIKFNTEQTNILKSSTAPLDVFVANKTEEQLMLELIALATLFAFAFCATLSVLCVLD
jgi:hypothetical protein